MPGLDWPVRDTTSASVDFVFWTIELFIMPVFLVLAGIFAWQSLDRHGARKLVIGRAKRLLIPLAFGMLVVLPLDLYVWVLGWVAEGIVPAVKLKSLKFDDGVDANLWGLSHLWFLQYLFLYVVGLALLFTYKERLGWLARIKSEFLLGTALALSAAAVLYAAPEVVWGFQHAFLPVPTKWIYSGTFFAGGVLIAKSDPGFHRIRSFGIQLIAPACLLCAFAVPLGQWHLAGGQSQIARAVLACITVTAAWAVAICVLSLSVRRVSKLPTSLTYLSAASFWIYVFHHPFLGLIHIDLKWLLPETNATLKTALAFTVCVGFCLLTYEGLIRKSWLGSKLGMAWRPKQIQQPAVISMIEPSVKPTERRRAA